jgi:hypothetical protein
MVVSDPVLYSCHAPLALENYLCCPRRFPLTTQNFVVTLSFVNGMNLVVQEYGRTTTAITENVPLSQKDRKAIQTYLNKLELYPS